MYKNKHFTFVTNTQNGACLLFDPKGLGYRQTQTFETQRLLKSLLNLFQSLNLKQFFFASLR